MMEMDDELANFIREQKARLAKDKASLEQDPPYMEIKLKPHKTYGSTAKENIPPRTDTQSKEESYNVGLPLGVEYERKKQRLRHELRMDYRRYMAQKKEFDPAEYGPLVHLYNKKSLKQYLFEEKADVLPKQKPPSLRDAGTLTEDNSGLHRALGPEEYEEQSSVAPRQHGRLVRPGNQESEDEELELMEGRRSRRTGVEATNELRLSNKADGRERRENPLDVPRESRRLRAQTKNEDAEFTTGLIIGAADTDEALQRKKERYRQELQEQIAEQHRNKKREKDLELNVAATGANDPEKQPNRIRHFGLSCKKDHQVLEPSTTGESKSSLRRLSNNEKTGVRNKEVPPPERPHKAYQSPLLEYSSALGLGGGGLSSNSQPVLPSIPRAMDSPRIPFVTSHPPPTLSEVYRPSYGEPHHYYGARNLPDPNMAYYGHLSVPGAGLPVSYWNVPAGGAVLSQLENPSPNSQHSRSSFPEPQIQPTSEAVTVDSQFRVFPSERAGSTRERILSYRDSLKQQIQEQQESRRLEREEEERYEAQLQVDMKNHQPWGRGGGGAPLRDSTGNLIADLNQMHKLNKEAYSNPEQWQRRATAAVTARQAEQPDLSERVSGFTHVHTPQFARGNVFANQPTQQHLQEQDKYKAFLKQQIEEKRRKKAEESERLRLEEEKEEKRLAEQKARIQKEYEEEQERKRQKEMEQKAKNEELIQLAEQRKKEADRRRKKEEEKERAALRRQYEMERQARVEEFHREPSPPIPTLQKKHGLHQRTPRPLTVESQHSAAPLSERSLSGLQSPPVPARRNQLRAAGNHRDVFCELSALRRQLHSEQKRLESRLHRADWEELESPLGERHRERPLVDVFDMARLRLQAPVRRPNSRNLEARNLQIHDPLQLKYTDGKSRLGSSEGPKLEQVGLSRRRWDYKEPYQQLSSQRSTVQDDYFDLSPPQQNDDQRSVTGGFAGGTLLESESAFIDPLGEAFPVSHTSDLEETPQLSARERRRLAKQAERPQERATSSQSAGYHENHFTHTGNMLQLKAKPSAVGRSQDRTDHLRALGRPGNTAGALDLSDDDSPPSQFSLHNRNYPSSAETVSTDPWMRPGTSETLTSLERPLRRDWLTT